MKKYVASYSFYGFFALVCLLDSLTPPRQLQNLNLQVFCPPTTR